MDGALPIHRSSSSSALPAFQVKVALKTCFADKSTTLPKRAQLLGLPAAQPEPEQGEGEGRARGRFDYHGRGWDELSFSAGTELTARRFFSRLVPSAT